MALSITEAKVTSGVDNVDSSAASFASNPAAGNLIVVSINGWRSGVFNMSTTGVTDNQGNTYTRIIQSTNQGSGTASIFYAYNVASSGTFTITVDPDSTGNYLSWVAYNISGATTADPLDKSATDNGVGLSATSGSTGTLSQANEFVTASMTKNGANANVVEVTVPLWITDAQIDSNAVHQPTMINSKIVGATTALAANWTIAGSEAWTAVIATFKEGAGGAASTFIPKMTLLGVG